MRRWQLAVRSHTMALIGEFLNDSDVAPICEIFEGVSETDASRAERAAALNRAAAALGPGEWYLRFDGDVMVRGTNDGQPWSVRGVPIKPPVCAVAPAGRRVVLADDIVLAVAFAEFIERRPHLAPTLAVLNDAHLRIRDLDLPTTASSESSMGRTAPRRGSQ